MLLRQIYYFSKVIECNSFTEAAEECFISQSAISQQIQALETDLGVQLIVRENRRFTLTPAGEYFYKNSLILLDEAERLKKETRRMAGGAESRIRIGYSKNYGLLELQQSIALFTEKYPDIDIQIVNGNHEDLYDYIRLEDVDMVINDQRRALSDEYINFYLCTAQSYVEISTRSPVSQLEKVNVDELAKIPCILVASSEQQANEQEYYQNIIGVKGYFIFAENLEEGRILVAGNKGFMPLESVHPLIQTGVSIQRIPFVRNNEQIERKYFAFWKKKRDNEILREFALILKQQFDEV